MWGEHDIRTEEKMREYVQVEPNKGMKNLKDVITAIRYHQHPTIHANLQRQSRRIGEMLDRLDSVELPKVTVRYGGRNPVELAKYQKKDLKKMWDDWIQARAEIPRSKAELHLDRYFEAMEPFIQVDDSKADPDIAALGHRVKKLGEEIEKVKQNPWRNPF